MDDSRIPIVAQMAATLLGHAQGKIAPGALATDNPTITAAAQTAWRLFDAVVHESTGEGKQRHR